MPAIRVVLHGDHRQAGREAGADRLPVIHTTEDWTIDPLEKGMVSGATSLAVMIPAKVDSMECLIISETSLAVFMNAAATLAARFREEVTKPGFVVLSPKARAVLLPRLAEAVRRAVPTATSEQANEAANMIVDAFGADAP